jgi:methionyl-tRNA synthetase
MNKFYITTAIDYVNDVIHVGHIFQKLVADVLARYWRIKLGEDNVFFLTGTDEYGQKVERAAEKAEIPPKEFADKISKADQEQQDSLNISYNRFIRTTDPDHQKVVEEIWKRADQNGDIYLGEYKGLYCEGCEAYYTDEDLIDGKCCPYHPNLEIKEITEKNYFFKWSKYKEFLTDHIKSHPSFIIPESRRNEMLEFVKNIKDIPISRSNFRWGIPVPGDPSQVIYVWFDALINYLTGVGFLKNPDLFKKFWPADVHILGKDNVRWHALLWPAMLKSAGIELPRTVLVNGFLSLNGQKISKSLGNIIRPTDWVEKFGVDAVRYYLLRYTTVTEDSNISEEKLIQAYNSDLANGLGNLVARVARLSENNHLTSPSYKLELSPAVTQNLENYKLNEALVFIWGKITEADKKVNEEKPWELSGDKAKEVLFDLVQRIQQIAFDLQPFLPQTADKILKQFSGEIKSAPPLFPRI